MLCISGRQNKPSFIDIKMSDSSFTTADELGYFWLKRVCAYDYRRAKRTLQVVIAWIEKIKTFASACHRSFFLSACAYDSSSGAFISYPRFPKEPKTVNKWLSVSAVGDGQRRKINVINVDRDGKMRKCYTTRDEYSNFPRSLEDLVDYEVFYHGTSHQSAVGIMNKIDLAHGKVERDFSGGDGFYLGKNFDEALETNWARNRPPNSAVLACKSSAER